MTALSEVQALFSQKEIKERISEQLNYHERQIMNVTFGTDYDTFFTQSRMYSYLSPELKVEVAKLFVNSKPLRVSIFPHSPKVIEEGQQLPKEIQEVSREYFLTEDGIYPFNGQRISSSDRIVRIFSDKNITQAVDQQGNLYAIQKTEIIKGIFPWSITIQGKELVKVNTPYPIQNITVFGRFTENKRAEVPFVLGKDGQFGSNIFPDAIKVVIVSAHPSYSVVFLNKNGTVDFYHQSNMNQPISSDNQGDIVDMNIVDNFRLIGLTTSHRLVAWGADNVRENYPTPKAIGRIIRIGQGFVLDEYGTLYMIYSNPGGNGWIKVSHDYLFSQIPNEEYPIDDDDPSIYMVGKPLSKYTDFNTKFVRNVQIITVDIYGNQLIKYSYGQYGYYGNFEIRMAWIHPKTPNHQPVNITPRTSVAFHPHLPISKLLNGYRNLITWEISGEYRPHLKQLRTIAFGEIYHPHEFRKDYPDFNLFYFIVSDDEEPPDKQLSVQLMQGQF